MKRILSLILFCTIIVSSSVFSSAEYTDINLPDAPYTNAAELVTVLGLMEPTAEGSFSPEAFMTRGDFLNAAAPLMGVDISIGSAKQVFSDVAADSPYAAAVSAAYDLGIVSAQSKLFYPDRNISYNEAVKIFIHILGYELHSGEKGGYPSGYLTYANYLGITDGLVLGGDEYITRGEIALLMVNSMETVIYSLVDKHLLMERIGLKYSCGRMTSNSNTSVTAEADAAPGKLAIEFSYYRTERNYDHLLGYNVICYYRELGGVKYVEYIHADGDNSYTSISKEDIVNVSGRNISYEKNGKIKTITVPGDVYMIYNHFAYVNYPNGIYDISSGEIGLLDNNGDGTTDIAFVYEYTNHLLKSVDANAGKLYGADGKLMEFDQSNGDKLIDTDTGTELSIDDMAADMFVSLFENKERKKSIIYVNKSVAEGILETIEEDAVIIDGTRYLCTICDELTEKLGTKVRLYLDCRGNAVALDKTLRSGLQYGYILMAGSVSGMDPITQLQLMKEDGTVGYFVSADNVKLDGKTIKGHKLYDELNSMTVDDPSKDADGNDSLQYKKADYYTDKYSMLVRYRANSEGEITEIDTPKPGADEGDDSLKMSARYPNENFEDALNYRTETRIFGGAFGMESSAKVFYIPEGLSSRRNYSEDLNYDFKVDTVSSLENDTNYPTSAYSFMEAYNFDGCRVSDVLVIYVKVPDDAGGGSSDDTLSRSYPTLIVEEVTDIVMPNGDSGKKLIGTGRNGQISLTMTKSYYEKKSGDLEAGNIIGYNEIGGQLSKLKLLLPISDVTAKTYVLPETSNKYRESSAFAFGKVKESNDSYALLDDGAGKQMLYELRYIFIYNISRGTVRPATAADIRSEANFGTANATNLFVYTNYGCTRLAVIFE